MAKHIMVDLETWGLVPGSDIASIGAVVYDPIGGTLGNEFYVNVTNGEQFGLTRDASTLDWWSQQLPEARARLFEEPCRTLPQAVLEFYVWWNSQSVDEHDDYVRFWAHGPHFDEQILAAAFRAANVCSIPWSYKAPRDCRTIWDLVEHAGVVYPPFEGVVHDALADAKHQALCIIEAYRYLPLTLTEDMKVNA